MIDDKLVETFEELYMHIIINWNDIEKNNNIIDNLNVENNYLCKLLKHKQLLNDENNDENNMDSIAQAQTFTLLLMLYNCSFD
jgi:hypothetical protein